VSKKLKAKRTTSGATTSANHTTRNAGMVQSRFATRRQSGRFAGGTGKDELFTVIIILIGRAPPVCGRAA
jgi:hypothetical protein